MAAFPSAASSTVIHEGDLGDKFYIIKAGEAMVLQGGREVNRLFAAEFFGERALLADEPRWGGRTRGCSAGPCQGMLDSICSHVCAGQDQKYCLSI